MILALGDPNAEISASMLPAEVGALVPAVPSGIGGEKLLSLPLRDAREAFERDYLVAQISRFGGTYREPPNSSAWSARRCTEN